MCFLVVAGCRIGFDPQLGDAMPADGMITGDGITDGPRPDGFLAPCPATYQTVVAMTSKYRPVENTSASWDQAQAACAAEGQHLAIFETQNERDVIATLLPTRDFWVGVTDRVTLGTWLTVTGVPATYLPWTVGEPDVVTTERCVETESPAFNYIDQLCSATLRYVCECDGVASDPSSY